MKFRFSWSLAKVTPTSHEEVHTCKKTFRSLRRSVREVQYIFCISCCNCKSLKNTSTAITYDICILIPDYVGRISQSVYRFATGWTVRGSNPAGGEIFCTRPDLPWGPPSFLYNGYQVFSRGKTAGAWRCSPTQSSAEVKGRVELYLYSASGPSWPVTGWILPLPDYNYVPWRQTDAISSHET